MSIKKAAGGKQPVFKLNKGELWAFAVRRVVELLQKRRETVSNCVSVCAAHVVSGTWLRGYTNKGCTVYKGVTT